MSLFEQGIFKLHSGGKSWFKIQCAFLSDQDWRTIARLISEQLDFKDVIGIPTGGLKLAEALKPYCKDKDLSTLIVDDVLTTSNSMEKMKEKVQGRVIGVVLFTRGEYPNWIWPVFEMKMHPIKRRK